MNRYRGQATSARDAKNSSDTTFDLLLDDYCDALNHFASLRRWPPHDDTNAEAATREELRAAAQALRDAVDRLADCPEWLPDDRWTGATLKAKAGIVGDLLVDSEAHEEPWLAELAMRLAKRAVAVERREQVALPTV